MRVAEWRGWLVYDDNGYLDLDLTAKNLKAAKRILLATIKRGKAPSHARSINRVNHG